MKHRDNIQIEYVPLMTKSKYNTILKNKMLSPKSSSKWINGFDRERNWACIAKWKLKHQTEVKIAEFKY